MGVWVGEGFVTRGSLYLCEWNLLSPDSISGSARKRPALLLRKGYTRGQGVNSPIDFGDVLHNNEGAFHAKLLKVIG